MIGLTGMKAHDEYTFTHMVNVSILTMAQARTLGIEGPRAARARARRHAARHRQGAHAARGAQQARRADARRARHHAAPPGRRRRHPPRRRPTCRRLAAIVAFEHHLRARRHRVPRRRPARRRSTSATGALRHRRRVRRDAVHARLPAGRRRPPGSWRSCSTTTAAQFDPHLVRRFIDADGRLPAGDARAPLERRGRGRRGDGGRRRRPTRR